MNRKAFTLIELLVVIAIIAILAAILFPVFAQARSQARAANCISNVKQSALGVLMYAQDYDETIPQLDNDRSAGSTINWGDPGTDPNHPLEMFMGVVQPYIKNWGLLYCPEIGKTDWRSAIPAYVGRPYNAAMDTKGLYTEGFCQHAINLLLVEWGARGSIAAISRPAEIIMLAGDSVWDNTAPATTVGVGNTGVWPNRPGTNCFQWGQGWTWYVHRNKLGRGGSRAAVESGRANIAYCDGHVKSIDYNQLERCDFNTASNVWTYTFWDYRY